MQQRRYRPGDVLDDYCPRERRITDHAIVAMIDDRIKQTRCVVCDAEHEYKDGKIPPQRRKKPQAALFKQVLDGLNGPQPAARLAAPADEGEPADHEGLDVSERPGAGEITADAAISEIAEMSRNEVPAPDPAVVVTDVAVGPTVPPTMREDGPWRRQLIRAALPRPEGQQPPATRPAPEFTVRQPNNARGPRHGRRRGGGLAGSGVNGNQGPMRFGRGGQHQGQPQGHGGRRRRGRGGKKHS